MKHRLLRELSSNSGGIYGSFANNKVHMFAQSTANPSQQNLTLNRRSMRRLNQQKQRKIVITENVPQSQLQTQQREGAEDMQDPNENVKQMMLKTQNIQS